MGVSQRRKITKLQKFVRICFKILKKKKTMAHLGGFESLDFAALQAAQIRANLEAEKLAQERERLENGQNDIVHPTSPEETKEVIKMKIGPKSKISSGSGEENEEPDKTSPTMGPKSKIGPKSMMGPKSKIGPKSKTENLAAEDNGDNGVAYVVPVSPTSLLVPGLGPNLVGEIHSPKKKPGPKPGVPRIIKPKKKKIVSAEFIGENGEPIPGATPEAPKEKARLGPNCQTQIISEEFFECEGTWKKTIQRRSTGDHVDPYLYPPEGKKLRSGNDLIDFIVKHPHYWNKFDPTTINFERSKGAKMSAAGRKLVKFLELVRAGTDKDEAMEM